MSVAIGAGQGKRNRDEGSFSLAINHYQGSCGVVKDLVQARQLFTEAAREGHTEATYYLGKMLIKGEGGEQLKEKGIALLKSIEEMDRDALDLLAAIYLDGKYGIVKDTLQALQFLKKASLKNSSWAIDTLVQISLAEADKENSCTMATFTSCVERIKVEYITLMKEYAENYFEKASGKGKLKESVLKRNAIKNLLER